VVIAECMLDEMVKTVPQKQCLAEQTKCPSSGAPAARKNSAVFEEWRQVSASHAQRTCREREVVRSVRQGNTQAIS